MRRPLVSSFLTAIKQLVIGQHLIVSTTLLYVLSAWPIIGMVPVLTSQIDHRGRGVYHRVSQTRPVPLTSGIPRGSGLGPTLFINYTVCVCHVSLLHYCPVHHYDFIQFIIFFIRAVFNAVFSLTVLSGLSFLLINVFPMFVVHDK